MSPKERFWQAAERVSVFRLVGSAQDGVPGEFLRNVTLSRSGY